MERNSSGARPMGESLQCALRLIGSEPLADRTTMKYAGPFRRLYAQLIDALVLLPLSVFTFWAMWALRGPALAVLIPVSLVGPAYHIWFHARSGQTIGKRVAE